MLEDTLHEPTNVLSERKMIVNNSITQDVFEVLPVNHCWLHVRWELTPKTLERAVAGMGPDWHRSQPALRVTRILHDDSGPHARELHKQLDIPTNIQEWFVDIPESEDSWGIELGYASNSGRFFSMLHSVPVATPHAGNRVSNASDVTPSVQQEPLRRTGVCNSSADFELKTELVITGSVHPSAILCIDDSPLPIDPKTGEFQWRTTLVNGRFVVPIEATTERERQRVLLAIEANSHYLDREPINHRM